jgi:hypothetical protein
VIDGYVRAHGRAAPLDELPRLRDGFDRPTLKVLDQEEAGVTTVIWVTGYRADFGHVKLPVLDGRGISSPRVA